MVTTPQEVALIDAVKAMNMFLLPHVNVPILGVVENMSWLTPEELPDHKYFIFGKGGGNQLAQSAETKLLAQFPLVQSVREGGDEGHPVATKPGHVLAETFRILAENVVNQVNLRNDVYDPTEIVKVER